MAKLINPVTGYKLAWSRETTVKVVKLPKRKVSKDQIRLIKLNGSK